MDTRLHVFGWDVEREAALCQNVARGPVVGMIVEGLRKVDREPAAVLEECQDRVLIMRSAASDSAPGQQPPG